MSVDRTLIAQAKKVLQHWAGKIPPALIGTERQFYINEHILKHMPEEHRLLLQNLFKNFLQIMRHVEASDIEVGSPGANSRVWLRIQGVKKPYRDFGDYTNEEADILLQSLLSEKERQMLLEKLSHDFSYIISDGGEKTFRYRATMYFELHHLALNMRAINTFIRPYPGFNFHPNVTRIMSLAHTKEGLILITGITGSGKSTTLDAIVDLNNQTVNGHIVIIASPVEFVHTSQKCIIRHREVGTDTLSFSAGARESLRQDPDIIIVGEMRDPETIMTALEVADSGHKVFSTLHTSSAVESIDRIIGEVPPLEQNRVQHRLADILRCVVSQKLVPGLDGRLILAKEVLVMIPSVRAAIKNGNTGEIYQMISEGREYGMHTLEQDLLRLYRTGKISLETALNYANNKRRMKQLLHDKLLLKSL